jgi:hypothetical protein
MPAHQRSSPTTTRGEPWLQWGCPIPGCGHWVIIPYELEGHAAAEHPGWVARYELLRLYPNQLERVVYRRSTAPTVPRSAPRHPPTSPPPTQRGHNPGGGRSQRLNVPYRAHRANALHLLYGLARIVWLPGKRPASRASISSTCHPILPRPRCAGPPSHGPRRRLAPQRRLAYQRG